MRRTLCAVLSTLLGLTGCTGGVFSHGDVPDAMAPDLALVNGKFITVDPSDSIAEAVTIRGGRIAAIGTSTTILKLTGAKTRVLDLNGLTATPGLIDAHCHFAAGGVGSLVDVDLSFPAVRTIADIVERVRNRAASLKEGEWVRGTGWDEGKLEERRYVYASDLDAVSGEHPVWLLQTNGHYGTANSAALKLAGINRNTKDPPAGTIDRGPSGSPTGLLREHAMGLVTRLLPPVTVEQRERGIAELVKGFNREGLTAAKDPGIPREAWEAYQNVLARGGLNVRIFVLWSGGESVEYAENLIRRVGDFTKPYLSKGYDRLISGGVKLFMDGSGGGRTAWLYDEWNRDSNQTDSGNRGYPLIDPETYRKMVLMYHNAGIHIGTHAIGDRAIDWVVDSYEAALKQTPTRGLRHSIIHAYLPTDRALDSMARLQREYDAGYPEADAVDLWWVGDTYAGNFGPERRLRLKPYRTFLQKGIKWAATSDYPVDPYAARYGIWAQMAREALVGVYGKNPFGMAEAVDVRSALRAYTTWAAHQLFMEDKIGSLEVGKYADIAIWDKDLYSASLEEIKNLQCRMTLFQGKIVYRADNSGIREKS